jgi:hypothetical protein
MDLQQLWEEVQTLSREQQDELLRRLLQLRAESLIDEPLHDILEFEGMAAHIADPADDPQEYVNRMRRSEWR